MGSSEQQELQDSPNEARSDDDENGYNNDNADDLAKSKYMMKSIAGLLTTASVYAGMNNAQEMNVLSQVDSEESDSSDSFQENIGRNEVKSKKENLKTKSHPEVPRLDKRKPTLFDFSITREKLSKDNVAKLRQRFCLDEQEPFLNDFLHGYLKMCWFKAIFLLQQNISYSLHIYLRILGRLKCLETLISGQN